MYVCVNPGHCVTLRALGKEVVSQIMPDESRPPVSHCLFPLPSLMLRHNDCPPLPLLPPVPMTEGSGGVRPSALFNRPHWLDIMPNGRGHHSGHSIMSDGRGNHTRSCGVMHLSRVTTRHDHTGQSLTVVMPKLRKGAFSLPRCGRSPVYRCREMAARALVPLVPADEVPHTVQALLAKLPGPEDRSWRQNHIHGTLLQVHSRGRGRSPLYTGAIRPMSWSVCLSHCFSHTHSLLSLIPSTLCSHFVCAEENPKVLVLAQYSFYTVRSTCLTVSVEPLEPALSLTCGPGYQHVCAEWTPAMNLCGGCQGLEPRPCHVLSLPLPRPPTCSGLSWTPHTGHTHTGSRT